METFLGNREDMNQPEIDSFIYNVNLTIENGNIIKMQKFYKGAQIEAVIFDYKDTLITKKYFRYDSLISKRLYYLNNEHYAKFSIDSFFYDTIFFKTTYSYDEIRYLTAERFEPGIYFYSKDGSENLKFYNYSSDSPEYTEFDYMEFSGNIQKDRF